MAISWEGKHMVIALLVLMFVSVLLVAVRIYAKRKYGKPIGKDDFVLLAAEIFLIISSVLSMVGVGYGYGQRLEELKSNPVRAVQLIAVAEFFAVCAVALGKTSIAMTLLVLARDRWHRRAIWGLAVSVVLAAVGFAIFLWVAIWNQLVETVCRDQEWVWGLALTAAVWSAISDFVFAILPWDIIRKLHMQKAEKIGLGVVMSLGIVSGATAVVKATHMSCKDFAQDITYNSVPLIIWTFAEPASIIFAASIPVFRFFIKYARQGQSQEGIIGGSGGYQYHISHSESFQAARRAQRESWASLWSLMGGPGDAPIPLETLSPREDRSGIVRTDEVRIGVEERGRKTDDQDRILPVLAPAFHFPSRRRPLDIIFER